MGGVQNFVSLFVFARLSRLVISKKEKEKEKINLKISIMNMEIMFLFFVLVSSLAALSEAANCDSFSSRETEGYW